MKSFVPFLCLVFLLDACVLFKQQVDTNNPSTTTETDNPNEKNQELLNNLKSMALSAKYLEDGDSLRILFELEIPRLEKKDGRKNMADEFSISYGLLANYNSADFLDKRIVKLPIQNITKLGGIYYAHFNIEKRPIISALLILEVLDTKNNQKITQDIPINYTITKVREIFGLFEKTGSVPRFSNYLINKDTIQIKNLKNTAQRLYVRRFKNDFQSASPPMAIIQRTVPKNLMPDSVFQINTNEPIRFDKSGLYLVQSDTNQYYGLSFYVAERKYPKLSKITDLVSPLIYLTTEEEYNSLQVPNITKKDMDIFWLKLTAGNARNAKNIIRTYYNRVKLANKFFTTWKEGWKTDMGMVFIIFGGPNKIIRTNEAEYWQYNSQNGTSTNAIKFTFAKKPNQFTDESYNLLRFAEYEEVWYAVIELWRTGKIQ